MVYWQVVFKNMASLPYSIHPHGVMYTKANEGAVYMDGMNGMQGFEPAIEPGEEFEYEWQVTEDSGPTESDTSSILWAYHSHVMEVEDVYAGLVGPMVIYRKGMLNKDGLPKGIDQEYVAYLTVEDESASHYLEANIAKYAGNRTAQTSINNTFIASTTTNTTLAGNITLTPTTDEAFQAAFDESNKMHNINGYMYGNIKYSMCIGQHVRWYTLAMGNEVDLHTAHWHGQTLVLDGHHRVDTVDLLPATFHTLDMVPRQVGTWLFHCHVNDHIQAGMALLASVGPSGSCSVQEG